MADAEDACTLQDTEILLAKGGHPSGLTPVKPKSAEYVVSTFLIGVGVDFDTCGARPAKTLVKLSNFRDMYNSYKSKPWANSARLDNQGDFKHKNFTFARLAVQLQNYTTSQANVQLGINFGKRAIRRAMVTSIQQTKIIWLSSNTDFIAKAKSLGHSVMTLEMCQAIEQEDAEQEENFGEEERKKINVN